MNRYWPGILIGTVLSFLIGVAIALAVSQERRQYLNQRLEELRKALPGKEEWKHVAQEVTTKARETGSHLGEQVQESANTLGQRAQEILGAAQQTASSLGTTLQTKSADLVNGRRERT